MKFIRSANLHIITFVTFLVGAFFLSACPPFSGEDSLIGNQDKGWKVWVRTEPCAGRFDWLSVAKEPQGGGKSTYVPYETVLGNQGCTLSGAQGCSFQEAKDLMERLRGDEKFFDYCCRDYSVWENAQTGKMSVVEGKYGNAGEGWSLVKGDLCCEEAEELSGVAGACSGSSGKAKGGAGSFNGTWNVSNSVATTQIHLVQTGNRVTGTINEQFYKVKLEGTLSGRVLRFKWDNGSETGTGEVTLSPDGESFSGYWSTGASRDSVRGTKTP